MSFKGLDFTGIAQSTGHDHVSDKGEYIIYDQASDINTASSIAANQVRVVLDKAFTKQNFTQEGIEYCKDYIKKFSYKYQ